MKQTENGLIPDDWEVRVLEEICDTSSGGTPSRSNTNFFHGDIKWFTTTELKDCFLYDSIEHISKSAINSSSAKLYPENTLLMAMYGATIGRLGVLKNVAATNQACCAIFPKTTDVMYLFYYLLFKRDEIVAFGSGAGQPNISQNIVRKLLITLPPLAEQQRIAKALSDVDALIFTTEKLLQKKKNIKQGTMQELLTGKKRLPGFAKSTNYKQSELGLIPEDWEVKSLGELFDMKAGGDVDKEHFSYCKSSIYKYKIFSNGLENEGIYGYTDLPKYKGNAITITGRGTVGIAMFREEDFDAVIRLLVLNSKNDNLTNNSYITEEINSCISFPNESTGVPQLTVPQIRDIVIVLPSKEEQTAIANVLSSMDKEIENLNTKLEKYRNLKNAMMQQLLTGKIRLVN